MSIDRKNSSEYVISNRYPYLKQERWYCLIAQNKALLHFDKFTFEGKQSKEIVYNHPGFMEAGAKEWKVYILPDSYFGFDIETPLKFHVVKRGKTQVERR